MSSLEADLRSSGSVNGQLQRQLVEERGKGDKEVRTLRRAKEDLEAQVRPGAWTAAVLVVVNKCCCCYLCLFYFVISIVVVC